MAYSGNHFTRDWIVNEKENPITGTPYAWVRARVLGGKTNIWGRVSLRFSELDLKAKSHDGFGEDWPIGYADISPYYDKVDTLLGISGTKENIPHLPDGIFQRPLKLNCGEVQVQRAIAKMGRKLIPGPRRRHDRRRAEQQVPGALHGARPLRPRLRSQRGVPLAGRADLPGARHRQPDVRPNSVVSEVLIDDSTNKATGVRVIDSEHEGDVDFKATRRDPRRPRALESTRLLLTASRRNRPNGAGELVRRRSATTSAST